MSVILLLLPLSILMASLFVAAFLWAVRSGQYDDTTTPAMRVLFDPAQTPTSNSSSQLTSDNTHERRDIQIR